MKDRWDTEEVLAFVHDVRPWRDLKEKERAEWCRRVKHVRDHVTTDGKAWTDARLAALFGLAPASLRSRFSRSAGQDWGARPNETKAVQRATSEFKRAPAETKAAIVEAALADPVVREAARAAFAASDRAARADGDNVVRSIRREAGTNGMLLESALERALRILRSDALPAAQDVRLSKAEQTRVDGLVERLQAAVDLIQNAATSGDWDDELAALVAREG